MRGTGWKNWKRFKNGETLVLILHADDIGMCEEANLAVIPYLVNQQIQSASVMMPCEYSDAFMQWFKANEEYDIGLHLTLTSEWETWRWSTVAEEEDVPGLLDGDEFMWPSAAEVVQNARPEEVEKEIRAQIQKAFSLGVKPTHVDTHMGTLYASNAFSKVYMDIAEEYQIPARVIDLSNDAMVQKLKELGYPVTDDLIAVSNNYAMPKLDDFGAVPGGTSYEEVRAQFFEQVQSLNSGITEITFHPSVKSDNLKEITDSWQQRVWEAQLFSDPEVINFLEKEEIIFTTWKELMKRYFSYVNKDDETCNDNMPCYPTIQDAIDAATSRKTIKITLGSYDENLALHSSKILSLGGGWDFAFTTQSSNTSINSLTISSGVVTIDSIVIQ
ncbi:YdjC-like protein [delta proteobacterium NaphS2]|nr:YdjC-like protein [delta proteobacterium NaphS2]